MRGLTMKIRKYVLAGLMSASIFMIACESSDGKDDETTKEINNETTVNVTTEETTTEGTTTVVEEESTPLTALDGVNIYQGTMKEDEIPESFMISDPVRIDRQGANMCSGYALALILRYYGEDITGEEVYNGFAEKDPDGSVWMGTMIDYIDATGKYKATLYTGTLDNLKEALNKGYPVLIAGKVSYEETGLHDMVLTGYDKDYVYIADSYLFKEESDYYNRKVDYDEFAFMWDTEIVGGTQLFMVVEKTE